MRESSIFIAIIGILLPYFSFLLYDIRFDYSLFLSSFLLTFTVYSLDKVSNIKEDSISLPDRAKFISKHRMAFIFISISAYIVAFILSFLKNLLAIFIVIFPLFIGLVYSIRISSFRLKDIFAVKNITIALSWAFVGTFLPLVISFRSIKEVILIFYFFFIKCFINTVIYDIRDIEGDRINGVKTIPTFWGVKKTKKLLLILNSTLLLWIIFSCFQGLFERYLLVIIFTTFYGYWYIQYFSKEGKQKGTSIDLLVDGEWIHVAILSTIIYKI